MTDAERLAWDEAEIVAAAYVRAHRPEAKTPVIERHESLPYLFSVAMTPPVLLVRDGAVVEERTLAALGAYAESIGMLGDGPLPDVLDMQSLLYAFDAFPPTLRHDRISPGEYQLAADPHPLLHPRLERNGDRVELHIYYIKGSGRGAVADPDNHIRVAEWILIFEKGMPALWTRRQRNWSHERENWNE
jgi:hypothetical protein